MSNPSKSRSRAIVIIALAAVGGLLAGLAVFAFQGGFGNRIADIDEGWTSGDEYAACEENGDVIASLSPFITGEVAALIRPESSLPVSGLSFLDEEGDPASIADYSGSVVLLNLWATWCAPCRREMPALNTLQQERGGDDFQVLTVNVDQSGIEKPRAFIEEIGVTNLPLAADSTMQIFNDLKIEGRALGMPVTMLIDRNGCELATLNGPAEWASDDAFALIDQAIELTDG